MVERNRVGKLKPERVAERGSFGEGNPTVDNPDFTIGMACYDNFDEVYFTIQSLRFHHAAVMDRFEIIVVDNHPGTIEGNAVKSLIEGRVKSNGRYVPFPSPRGSCPPRGHLFDVARGKFVVCIDSHVMFEPGVLKRLVDYFDANPDCDDLLQGPLVSNFGPHRLEGTHMRPEWGSEMFGKWGKDERGADPDGEPFEIQQHGLGFFAARRESWLRFHPDFDGFSGGEGYIHEKYRQAGRKTLCLPFARWVHKFARPLGIPHRPTRPDKIRNHVRGWMELGVDLADGNTDDPLRSMAEHYVGEDKMSAEAFEKLVHDVGYPDYRVKIVPKFQGIVIGPTSYGSFKMRGRPVARSLGFDQFNSRGKYASNKKFDVVFAVKAHVPPRLRSRTKRIVFEPLDLWFSDSRQSRLSPGEWLLKQYAANPFDDLVISTLPMEEAAIKVLPSTVNVHLIPHHADERIGMGWLDPDGPIVYAGHSYFIKGFEQEIHRAAERLGKRFLVDGSANAWKSLQGASLVLAPRLGSRSRMNLEGKPTIKIFNAAQAGIPCLATPDPAIVGLHPDVITLEAERWSDPETIAGSMSAAIATGPSAVRFHRDDWLAKISGLLKCE